MKNIVSEVEMFYKSKIKNAERKKVTTSKDAYYIFKSINIFNRNFDYKEMFYCAYLNKDSKILSVSKISEGGTAGTVVDIKIILQGAILQNATGLIICHNHPSGNLNPSSNDRIITKNIKEAVKLLDMSLLDHLIITSESYYSFSDEGII